MKSPSINAKAIIAERMRRQGLAEPLRTAHRYADLFRRLQPVSTVALTRPGDPPRLVHRTDFNDGRVADRMRARRQIVKGRFLGTNISYVLAEDLELYANAFSRSIAEPTPSVEKVLECVQTTGPLTARQIKEETGLLSKRIMPALHKLQKAFLVYEDQVDSEWDRAWYDFAAEWPEIEVSEDKRLESTITVLERFLKAHVFANREQFKDWSQLSVKTLTEALDTMETQDLITPCSIKGLGEGWTLTNDKFPTNAKPKKSVFMLHRADFLVRSHARELKRRFDGAEVLQYLLIDGELCGAVLGHWRFGPYDVDDILLDLPKKTREGRRDAIIEAVTAEYCLPRHRVLKYDGKKVKQS
ncbi:DNA glycosylase AlkZ-like family protein [Candidatus Hydrogenedentota bacterium]